MIKKRTMRLLPLDSGERAHLAAVDHARALLAAIVESCDDAILSCTAGGTITTWNLGAERLYGYAAEEVIGKAVSILSPPGQPDEVIGILALLARGGRIEHYETVRLCKDGSLVTVSLSMSPMHDAQGRLVGASAIARDVTERKRADEGRRRLAELERQNQQLAEANRLRRDFLAGVSHELRSPLTAIIGFGELVRDGKAGLIPPRAQRYVDNILASSRHLLDLINSVLELSRIDSGSLELRYESVSLLVLIREVVEALGPAAAAKQILVEEEVDPAVATAVLDTTRFKQVLFNYLSNAIKFTGPPGHVVIRVVPWCEGTEIRLEVEDSGIGIRQRDLTRLFGEFVRLGGASESYPGTGLGLAVTKRIVEALGGHVGVESTPGVGSLFFAVVPRNPR